MSHIMLHYTEKLPEVTVNDLSDLTYDANKSLVSLNIDDADCVSMFFKDKASLFRFANSVTRAAANIRKPGECAVCGFNVEFLGHSAECPERPDESAKVPFAVEYVGKVMDLAFNAAMGKKPTETEAMARAMNADASDGPVADSDDGYKIMPDQQENDEPMTIGHVSGCLCSDCLSERARVIELGNRIEEGR